MAGITTYSLAMSGFLVFWYGNSIRVACALRLHACHQNLRSADPDMEATIFLPRLGQFGFDGFLTLLLHC